MIMILNNYILAALERRHRSPSDLGRRPRSTPPTALGLAWKVVFVLALLSCSAIPTLGVRHELDTNESVGPETAPGVKTSRISKVMEMGVKGLRKGFMRTPVKGLEKRLGQGPMGLRKGPMDGCPPGQCRCSPHSPCSPNCCPGNAPTPSNPPPTPTPSKCPTTYPRCPPTSMDKACPSPSAHLLFHKVEPPSEQDTTTAVTDTKESSANSLSSNFLRNAKTKDTRKPGKVLREATTTKSNNLGSYSDHERNILSGRSLLTSLPQGEVFTASRVKTTGSGDDEEFSTETNAEKVWRLYAGQVYVLDDEEGATQTSNIMRQSSDIIDEYGEIVGPSLETFSHIKTMVQDPSMASVCDTLGSMSEIAGMLIPAPAGLVIGIGMGVLGSLFGSTEEVPSTENKFAEIEENLRGINHSLVNMQAAIGDLGVSMQALTLMTQYNILVVEKVYQKLWVDPFHNIHAAYMDLIETYMPLSDDTSWDLFFEQANILRKNFGAEVYDAFEHDNLRKYLVWYETASVNDSGMCGQAMVYEYLMSIRAELFFITSYGSFVKSDLGCAEGKFCWEANPVLLSRYATKYKEQMIEYEAILTAQRRGGLGIAHLIKKSFSQLLEGVQVESGIQRGFCFKCDIDYTPGGGNLSHCNGQRFTKSSFPTQHQKIGLNTNSQWPSGNHGSATSNQLSQKLVCNSNNFSVKWWYFDVHACHVDGTWCQQPGPLNMGGMEMETYCEASTYDTWHSKNVAMTGQPNMLGCCSCSCMSEGQRDGYLGGTSTDHAKYDRHCPDNEEVVGPAPTDSPTEDMVTSTLSSSFAWYQGGTFDIEAGTWPDASGRGNDATLLHSGFTELRKSGHGASSEVVSLSGTTTSVVSFGDIIKQHFTICSVTRYTGNSATRGRILQGGPKNWLHGHWAGLAGVAYYEGWKTDNLNTPVSPVTDWLIMCGTNAGSQLKLVNGVDEGTATGGSGGTSLYVNAGRAGTEVSNFAIVEVVVWDRGLTDEEMNGVSEYLIGGLDGGPGGGSDHGNPAGVPDGGSKHGNPAGVPGGRSEQGNPAGLPGSRSEHDNQGGGRSPL